MMKRKALSLILALVLVFSLVIPAAASDGSEKVVLSPQTIVVNGKAVSAEVYNIDGNNYFKLRDIAKLLNGTDSQFSVSYDDTTRTVKAVTGEAYVSVSGELETGKDKSSSCVSSTQKVCVDGLTLGTAVYNIGGNNFFKLRDLGSALGFDVEYDKGTNSAIITSAKADSVVFDVEAAVKLGAYNWVKSEDGKYYSLMNVHYNTNIVCPQYQYMNIYVPSAYIEGGTVNGYNAKTAPNVFKNNCSGWKSSTPGSVDPSYIAAGYVQVECGARSRGAGEGGQYGKSPSAVVDQKSGVRLLKLNDAYLPGDSQRIISVGTSGGGQMSTILGATGNMDEYYSCLYESGAAGVEYTNGKYVSTIDDSIYGCDAYCPIADINNADLAYAWWRYDSGDTQVTPMGAKEPVTFSAFKLALQNDLAQAYCAYINGLKIKDENGKVLSFDKNADGTYNPRSGSYYKQVLQNMSNALNAFVKNQEFPYSVTVGRGDAAKTTVYNTLSEYFAATLTNTDKWLTKNADGTYSITDMAGFIAGTKLIRNKDIPGFDTFWCTAENDAFGDSTEKAVHYSKSVAAVLKANYEKYSKLEGFKAEDVDSYIQQASREDIVNQTYLMNATQIMLGVANGTEKSDIAEYWRTRNGTADQHTSFSIAYNVCMAAKAAGAEVDYSLVWAMGHGSAEGTTTGTFVNWVKKIAPPVALTAADKLDLSTSLKYGDATVNELSAYVDGSEVDVAWYVAPYVSSPNRAADQLINIYVPENATADSPIIFNVNNSGWLMNAYAKSQRIEDGKDYDGTNDKIGVALKEGYVVVSYGARGRMDGLTGDEYLGHSPATMTDTKAAIRYLRYNEANLPAGDVEKIVVTGTSGGGALSSVIAASGNSSDYFPYLYEIGAAGISYTNGKYVSTVDDDVFATIAYCPITDLGNADAAYEWTYNETRAQLYADGNLEYDKAGVSKDTVMATSAELKSAYAKYVNSLGLKTSDGKALTADNLEDAIIALMETEIRESIKDFGIDKMKADIGGSSYNDSSWLTLNADGTYTYDYAKHLYFVAMNTKLKVAPAFSNQGMAYTGERNEDNLFGSTAAQYSPFEFWSWNNDLTAGNGVGKDDTGLTWDQYMATDAGKALALQIKMTSPMTYLTSSTEGDSAPYWYVRHGMKDRDTSFALQTVFYYAMKNDSSIKDVNFEFAWLQPHSGNYDVAEAYAWLKSIL